MKHGEIVKPRARGKSGFGLPVAILQKLLHAPRLPKPGEEYMDVPPEKSQTSLSNNPYTASFMSEGIPYDSTTMENSISRGGGYRGSSMASMEELISNTNESDLKFENSLDFDDFGSSVDSFKTKKMGKLKNNKVCTYIYIYIYI